MKDDNTTLSNKQSSFFNQDFGQKIALLVVTFTLTVIVGGVLSYYFQTRTSYINYRQGLIESERKNAREIFEDATNGMDSRIYFAQIVNTDLKLKSNTFDQKWADYAKELAQWNTKFNTRRQLINMYFDKPAVTTFNKIHSQFLALNRRLQGVRIIKSNAGKPLADEKISLLEESIDADIKKINEAIATLSSAMMTRMQNDLVGRVAGLKKYKFKDYIFE